MPLTGPATRSSPPGYERHSGSDAIEPPHYDLYLYPDQIRAWYLALLALFVFTVGLHSVFQGLLTGVALLSLYHFTYHHRLGKWAALCRLYEKWPRSTIGLFRSVPVANILAYEDHRGCRLGDSSTKERSFDIPLWAPGKSYIQPVHRRPMVFSTGSLQEVIVKSAIIELLDSPNSHSRDGVSPIEFGIRPWFFYFGAPVWHGYLVLLVLYFAQLFDFTLLGKEPLIFLSVAWYLYSVNYYYRMIARVRSMRLNLGTDREMLANLPLSVLGELHTLSRTARMVTNVSFTKTAAILHTMMFSTFFVLVALSP